MPTRLHCPAPDCRALCPAHDAASGRPVKCPKCGRLFVAPPTHDGQSKDTRTQPAGSAQHPFPTLPAEFGRFRVLELLGRGGMGAVYRALDTQLGQEVALKLPVFDPTVTSRRAERFVREMKSTASLDHPSICPALDAGQIGGRPFIAMELVVGRSLHADIDPDHPMPQVRAAGIARKLALALAHAHKRGVVHRDLKPANVMLTDDDEPVVMDFGLAKLTGETDADSKLTHTGALLGTPAYMPPEQVRGEPNVGPAADIYALGVVLFQMLTGRTPYTGGLTMIVGQILTAPVPSVYQYRADVDPRLEAICWRAMAKEPEKRFPSMAVMGMALAAYLASPTPNPSDAHSAAATRSAVVPRGKVDETPETGDVEEAGENRPTSRVRLWVVLAAGVLMLVIGIGLAVTVALLLWARVTQRPPVAAAPKMEAQPTEVTPPQGASPGPASAGSLFKAESVWANLAGTITLTVMERSGQRFKARLVIGTTIDRVISGLVTDDGTVSWIAAEVIDSKGGRGEDTSGTISRDGGRPVLELHWEAGPLKLWLKGEAEAAAPPPAPPAVAAAPPPSTPATGRSAAPTIVSATGNPNSPVTLTPWAVAQFRPNTMWVGTLDEAVVTLTVTERAGDRFKARLVVGADAAREVSGTLTGGKLSWVAKDVTSAKGGRGEDTTGAFSLEADVSTLRLTFQSGELTLRLANFPDRAAAEYVLSHGGRVQVVGHSARRTPRSLIASPDQLPAGEFKLTFAEVAGRTNVDDGGLAVFEGCTELASLSLSGCRQVTDTGVAHFRGCTQVRWLDLSGTRVADQCLVPFRGCERLASLNLGVTAVTDDALIPLRGCTSLTRVYLDGTKVTDKGLATFKDCRNINELFLPDTGWVDGSFLAEFADLSSLWALNLNGTACEDAGLAAVRGCGKLYDVGLQGTRVTDKGLAHLHNCPQLKKVMCQGTKVTAAGRQELQTKLPTCKIE